MKQILGYENDGLSHIPAVKWSIINKSTGREEYITLMSLKYENFTCKLCGLWINPLYPHMGASPDGLTKCGCCGNGLLEIKCPFSLKDVYPNNITSSTCAFITVAGCLNKKHKYYTQVQGQLMITNRAFCDFVIWTTKGLRVVQRIYRNVCMWEKLKKAYCILHFPSTYVLPEIMSHNLKKDIFRK